MPSTGDLHVAFSTSALSNSTIALGNKLGLSGLADVSTYQQGFEHEPLRIPTSPSVHSFILDYAALAISQAKQRQGCQIDNPFHAPGRVANVQVLCSFLNKDSLSSPCQGHLVLCLLLQIAHSALATKTHIS